MATGALLTLAACGPSVKFDALTADRASALCAEMETAAGVKGLLFDAAEKQTVPANRLALTALAKQANLRIERPLLDSYDAGSRKTACSGQLHMTLPPGAVRNLGDTSDLTASIKYWIKEPFGAGGLTYQVSGDEALASGLAGADITDWASKLTPAGMPAEGAPVPAAAPSALPPPSAAPTLQLPADSGAPVATPAAAPAKPAIAPQMRPVAAAAVAPGCRNARSFADRTICGDPALAAEDRRVEALYHAALASDSSGEVRRVAQSEWAMREGCQDRDCIVDWFKQREADLSAR